MAVLEATLKEFKLSVEKRFEQTGKRFERVDKRFEQVDKRMDSMITFIKILLGIFTAMTIATIGFAILDRWSASRLVEQRVIEVARTAQDEYDKKIEDRRPGKGGDKAKWCLRGAENDIEQGKPLVIEDYA
jgi:hypothetical protein